MRRSLLRGVKGLARRGEREMSCCFYVTCEDEMSPACWQEAMDKHLTEEEAKVVTSFVFRKDQERSLLSYLLQKFVIRRFLKEVLCEEEGNSSGGESGVPPGLETRYRIARTRENKPFFDITSPELAQLVAKSGCRFNYNVSHHGSYVGIVSHTNTLIGVDIVDISTRATWVKTLQEYIEIYRKQLSDNEMKSIYKRSSEEESYTHFYVLWSLKEAYVKAVGVGIGVDLKKVEFIVEYNSSLSATDDICYSNTYEDIRGINGSARVKLDDVLSDDWQFEFFSLDRIHVMTVGKGPIYAALESYQKRAWPLSTDNAFESDKKIGIFNVPDSSLPLFSLPSPSLLTLEQLLGL